MNSFRLYLGLFSLNGWDKSQFFRVVKERVWKAISRMEGEIFLRWRESGTSQGGCPSNSKLQHELFQTFKESCKDLDHLHA